MKLETLLLKIEQSFSITYVLLGGLIIFILWALWFDIDETVRAQGVVVANGRTQIIQSADGGVLSKLLVREGQQVKKGELLATLEKGRVQAGYHQVRSQVAHLKSALARANAQILDGEIVFDEVVKAYPDFMSAQQALYQQKKRSLGEEVSMLEDSLVISEQEWRITQNLAGTGDVSQLEVLRAKQKLLELERKIAEVKNNYYERTHLEIEGLEGELAMQLHKLQEQADILGYTDIRTPVSGVVKALSVTTVGGVLRAGEQLMEISPNQGGVIMEAKVNPADVGRLKLGVPTTIKLDAFDYTAFGGLSGEVVHISSDTLVEQDPSGRSQSFYRVNVEIKGVEEQDNDKAKFIQVKLGMSATVDMKVGTRSLFGYLTKPVARGFRGAFNER
ncbi:MAG: hypothetical protein A6F71_08820 [Cycloclasticus sp. symbiont of Poecilosclerida sp. M]|nr:MAG: hypothetical protein A6F71_08820 [Cycloclasticus sp. symbiont of Poecilosclerida sp. M]